MAAPFTHGRRHGVPHLPAHCEGPTDGDSGCLCEVGNLRLLYRNTAARRRSGPLKKGVKDSTVERTRDSKAKVAMNRLASPFR